MSILQVTWFFLIGALLTGYAILDGFDLGVGIWHLFAKKDKHRRIFLNAIGPVWDGNEVWLLTGAGALFAAFPMVYATVFSGFYLAMMLVLFGLIFRAVSIEFRGMVDDENWRRKWDAAFAVGSMLPAFLFGVALGNIIRGVPLDASGQFAGSFFGLLNPFALITGLLGFAMFATHGALYLALKTEGELGEMVRGWAYKAWKVYMVLFGLATIYTFIFERRLLENFLAQPVLWIIPAATIISIVMIGVYNARSDEKAAFISSSVSIASLMALAGATIFPNLLPAINNPAWGLTVAGASSSPLTLKVMLIVAAVGMPIVVGYTWFVYKTFSGKVKENDLIY